MNRTFMKGNSETQKTISTKLVQNVVIGFILAPA